MNATTVNAVLTAKELVNLYAEAVEGEMERSRQRYNAMINDINGLTASVICHLTPFEIQSVQIFNVMKDKKGFDRELCLNKVKADQDCILNNPWLDEKTKGWVREVDVK